MPAGYTFAVVSPVKNEMPQVERTLATMCAQTVRPSRWILVDDHSTDGTRELIAHFAASHPWMQLVCLDRNAPRQTGSRVISNFNAGLGALGQKCDFIVKLDCDIELPEDYFERLLGRFAADPRLGIASGVYEERRGTGWQAIEMPSYHAAGAMKMVRASCFDDIGGFVASPGWDTVDEVKARVRGWHTTHFPDLTVRHLKDEGTGVGFLKMSAMSGEIHYLSGGGVLFFTVKVLHRLALGRPVVLGSVAMSYGFLRCVFTGRKRLVNRVERRFYRRVLNARLLEAFRNWKVEMTRHTGARYS